MGNDNPKEYVKPDLTLFAARDRLWKVMTDGWANYDQYQHRTTRVIPVVVLERASS